LSRRQLTFQLYTVIVKVATLACLSLELATFFFKCNYPLLKRLLRAEVFGL
jgi:hypothetical protein